MLEGINLLRGAVHLGYIPGTCKVYYNQTKQIWEDPGYKFLWIVVLYRSLGGAAGSALDGTSTKNYIPELDLVEQGTNDYFYWLLLINQEEDYIRKRMQKAAAIVPNTR